MFFLAYKNVHVNTCIGKIAFENGLSITVKDLCENINYCLFYFLHSTGKCLVYNIFSC